MPLDLLGLLAVGPRLAFVGADVLTDLASSPAKLLAVFDAGEAPAGISALGAKFLQDVADELLGGASTGRKPNSRTQQREPVDVVAQRRGLQSTAEKLLTPEGMFETQVLLRTEARSEERTYALFRGVLQAFEIFAGEKQPARQRA